MADSAQLPSIPAKVGKKYFLNKRGMFIRLKSSASLSIEVYN